MKTCFFTECTEEVNARGKFCEKHDLKEQEAKTLFETLHLNVSQNELLVLESSIKREYERLKIAQFRLSRPEEMIVVPGNIEQQKKEAEKQIGLVNLLRHKVSMLID